MLRYYRNRVHSFLRNVLFIADIFCCEYIMLKQRLLAPKTHSSKCGYIYKGLGQNATYSIRL